MAQFKGSRTFPVAAGLTFAGGFLDAYTYFERGGVFANAQTGNIIKFGLALAQANMEKAIRYLIPITAFIIGVITVLAIESYMHKRNIRFIRRTVLLIEILSFSIVAFLPVSETWNRAATCLVSFACAMQMEGFKKFIGQPIATTVSTGNLRKAVEFLYSALEQKNHEHLLLCGRYSCIVLIFVFGVFAGAKLTVLLHTYSILIVSAVLLAMIAVITVKKRSLGPDAV